MIQCTPVRQAAELCNTDRVPIITDELVYKSTTDRQTDRHFQTLSAAIYSTLVHTHFTTAAT